MKGARSKADSANGSGRLAVNKAGRKTKKGKAAKDPNKPKRPPSAFFVFMEGFRSEFKEQNPGNKSVAALGKACGDKWRSMSDEDKAPFVAEAAKRKKDYEKNMDIYNRKLAGGNEDQESDKSKSEVNDDEEGSEEEEDDD